MKISQYNWNWWFVLNLLLLMIIICLSFTSPVTQTDINFKNIFIPIGSIVLTISMLPCLYIGCKPIENNN
jgi:hypothetical protein